MLNVFSCAKNRYCAYKSKRTSLISNLGLPIARLTSSSSKVLAGSKVEITCLITSIPDVENVYWHIGSDSAPTVISNESSNVNIKQSITNPNEYKLTIQEASVSLSGEYRCFAKNKVGTSKSPALVLKGK